MSAEAGVVVGGVAVVNKLTSSPLSKAQSVTLAKLGKSAGLSDSKKTLDVFSEEDQMILGTVSHGLACMLDARSAKTRLSAAAAAVTKVMMGPPVTSSEVVSACASICQKLLRCSSVQLFAGSTLQRRLTRLTPGPGEAVEGVSVKWGEGLAGSVAEAAQSIVIQVCMV
jgi:hypothetical protein